jgi:LuxR family transcriptional regulator, positive regulator of biofilm formation
MKNSILLICRRSIQNNYLAEYLSTHTNLTCTICTSKEFESISSLSPEYSGILLWEYEEPSLDSFWRLCRFINSYMHCFCAMINAPIDSEVYEESLARGAHGFFSDNDSLPTLSKGILAILEGELWFSRQTISKHIMNSRQVNLRNDFDTHRLTSRERQLLLLLALGKTNKEIAEEQCISQNTVKTHLYNIYGKINVKNRTQAALWMRKHL